MAKFNASQFKNKMKQQVNKINQAINKYNREVKRAVNDYNNAVRQHNTKVRQNRARIQSALLKLVVVYTGSVSYPLKAQDIMWSLTTPTAWSQE